MDQSELLRVVYLALVLAVIVAMRWWPGLNHRKFDWRWLKDGKRKRD